MTHKITVKNFILQFIFLNRAEMIHIIFLSLLTSAHSFLLHKPLFRFSFITHKSDGKHTVEVIFFLIGLFFSQTMKYDESWLLRNSHALHFIKLES